MNQNSQDGFFKRLRDEFMDGGVEAFAEYIFEILLRGVCELFSLLGEGLCMLLCGFFDGW